MQTVLFFVLGSIALYAAVAAYKGQAAARHAEAMPIHKRILPETVSMVLLSVHAAELVKVVEHASVVNVVAGLLILAAVIASRGSTDGLTH